jgi:hypothetical protein
LVVPDEVPLPDNVRQKLIRLDKHKPWTASNVAWCYAEKRKFDRVVPLKMIEEANRKGLTLVEESIPKPDGGTESVLRLVKKTRWS